MMDLQVGDVVVVFDARCIIRRIKGDLVMVAEGRTDPGTWVDRQDVKFQWRGQ